jgi:ABC-type hemin transport system ATPase subunit
MKFADRISCLLEGRLALQGVPSEISEDEILAAYFGV